MKKLLLLVFSLLSLCGFGQNLLTNGDLEDGTWTNWSSLKGHTVSSTHVYQGNYSGEFAAGHSYGGISYAVTEGKTYKLSIASKVENIDDNCYFAAYHKAGDNKEYLRYSRLTSADWTTTSFNVKAENIDVSTFRVVLAKGSGERFWIDNMSLEEIDPSSLSTEKSITASSLGTLDESAKRIKDLELGKVTVAQLLEALTVSEKAEAMVMSAANYRVYPSEILTAENHVRVFAEDGTFQVYNLSFADDHIPKSVSAGAVLDNSSSIISNVIYLLTVGEFINSIVVHPGANVEVFQGGILVADEATAIASDMTVKITGANGGQKEYSINLIDPGAIANVVQGKSVTASKISKSTKPEVVVDGDNSANGSRWLAYHNSGTKVTLDIDLVEYYEISFFKLYYGGSGEYGTPPIDFKLQAWDGAAWVNLDVVTANTNPKYIGAFNKTLTNKIRFSTTKSTTKYVRMFEIEVFGSAWTPDAEWSTTATSTDWNEKGNWKGGAVPSSGASILVPTGAPNYPVIDETDLKCSHLLVQDGADIDLGTDGFIEVTGSYLNTNADAMLLPVKFTFGASTFAYNEQKQEPEVTIYPSHVPFDISYTGGVDPIEIGTYEMVVTANKEKYSGSAKQTVTITKIPVEITLSNLNQKYDGTPKSVEYSLQSGISANVVITYDGAATAPTEVGEYNVVAKIDDDKYQGEVTKTLVITNLIAVNFVFGESTFVYTGEKQIPSVTTDPDGVAYSTEFPDGDPIQPGTYKMNVIATEVGYSGTSTVDITINKAPIEIELSGLTHQYDGAAKKATYKLLSDLEVDKVTVTYNGETTEPTEVGEYAVVVEIADDLYEGKKEGTLTITALTPVNFTFSDNVFVYNGEKQLPSIVTDPADIQYEIELPDGEPIAPGTYKMIVKANQTGYQGTGETTITIKKATIDIVLSNLTHQYDGVAKEVVYTLKPDVEVASVSVTYNGLETAPTEVGEYDVVVKINDDRYEGEVKGTLVIKNLQEVKFTFGESKFVYTGEQQLPSVTTSPEDVDYKIELQGGDAISAGKYLMKVTADQEGYTGEAEVEVVIEKAEVVITLENLIHQHDGLAKEVSYTLAPEVELEEVSVTYNGEITAPVEGGKYKVVVIINDKNYKGKAEGTLVINKVTSIEALDETHVKVFPSLSKGTFTVEMQGQSTLEVYTLSGHKVYTEILTGNKSTVSLPDDLKGMFLLKIYNNKGIPSILRHLIQK